MEFLIKGGVTYKQYDFHGKEVEFEQIFFTQYKHLFGDNAILFPKEKIKTLSGRGRIPDAFIIDLKYEKWFIVEIELSNHDVSMHIVPQLIDFSAALDNQQTRKYLIKSFEEEIKEDTIKKNLFPNKSEIFKTLTHIIDKEPELIIIIEQSHTGLSEVSKKLPFKTIINIFKVYCKDGFGLGDNIFQIEPLVSPISTKFQRKTNESKGKNTDNENEEIAKVKRKVPKWLKSPSQINYKILTTYMNLLGNNDSVNLKDLEDSCSDMKFKSNYSQMSNFGKKNNGKVFDENNNKVTLWDPVKEFIINEFNKFSKNRD